MRFSFGSRLDPFKVSFFHLPKWILWSMGLWPLDPFNRLTMLCAFVNWAVLLTAVVGEIRSSWIIRNNMYDALNAICPTLTKVVSLLKVSCFAIYRKELAKVLNQLLRVLKEDIKDSRKNVLIGKAYTFTMEWNLLLFFFGITTHLFFITRPLVSWTYLYLAGENVSWVELPFRAALPYDDMTQVQNKSLYAFVYSILAYSGNVTVFTFFGTDGAYICFCVYLSVSYQCLRVDFHEAFNRHIGNDLICKRNDLLYNELTGLMQRQQNILKMFYRFNQPYKLIIFGHFFFASIGLGVGLIEVLVTPGIGKIVYLFYSIGHSVLLFTYCYGAEKLEENSSKLAQTLYDCDWFKCDKRVRTLILFAIMKSQQGNQLTAPFFSPSLPLFAAIIKTSGSYITILKTFL